jgi:hypothetical protein
MPERTDHSNEHSCNPAPTAPTAPTASGAVIGRKSDDNALPDRSACCAPRGGRCCGSNRRRFEIAYSEDDHDGRARIPSGRIIDDG